MRVRRFQIGRVAACTMLISLAAWAQASTAPAPPLSEQLQNPGGFTVHYPSTWSVAPLEYRGAEILLNIPASALGTPAIRSATRLVVTTEDRGDHDAAVARLKEIEAEYAVPVTYLEIGGWPALQRRFEQEVFVPKTPGSQMILRVDTAIAAGDLVVRLHGSLPHGANPAPADELEAMGQGVTFVATGDPRQTALELDLLRTAPSLRAPAAEPPGSDPPEEFGSLGAAVTVEDAPGLLTRLQTGTCNGGSNASNACASNADCPGSTCNNAGVDSEIEMAASPDGRHIVVTNNGRDYATSNDGGATFTSRGIVPSESGTANGDPSIAIGATGRFYFAFIDFPAAGVCTTGISTSGDNGRNFAFRSRATQCNNNCFPDQEHIAADRINLSATNQDQIYSVWRDFSGGGCGGATPAAGPEIPSIVCSTDSGNNWTAKAAVGNPGEAYARVTVGPDGFVYVVYLAGNNVMLNKYSSCASGLVQQGAPFPKMIAAHNPVDCGARLPGIDRCNGRNTLASPVITVDETNASHIFVTYASNTVAGSNEDILVRQSFDGGANWGGAVRVNSAINARRFMPWSCVTRDILHVSWFDRRFIQPSDNSLTDFYRGTISNVGGSLVAGTEVRLTPVSDSQCLAGAAGPGAASSWPSAVDNQADSETCALALQPQLGGVCVDAGTCMGGFCTNRPATACTMNSQCVFNTSRCDFSDCGGDGNGVGASCQCNIAIGETCNSGRGAPKYGDYNGNACAAGRIYTAWASATSPSGLTPASGDIDVFFNQKLFCCAPQIQVPGSVALGSVCAGTTGRATLQVCNTGKEDLEVDPITSSNPRFAVTTPSSGYSVVISPDFCFPFEVTFSPTTAGPASATLTIPSNDTVNPSVQVQVTGTGVVGDIVTVMADAGSFGDVCVGSFKDLPLTISNSGGCELRVTGISSSSNQFQAPGVMSPPLVIAPGTSAQVPIRFAPTSFGAKAGTITIASNDPDTPNKQVSVSGNAPPGDVRVTGSTDFGDVCAGVLAEKTINVCNVGACNLSVVSVAFDPACADFTLINNPFPAIVSPDSCQDVVIRFTPTSAGPKTCTLKITTDDPDTPVVTRTVTANTPIPMIDVPPDLGFPPTVIQSVGACTTGLPFPVSNTGTCNLNITQFAITNNPVEYSLSGLPSFPIILGPGHIAGDGALETVFAPQSLDRDLTGALTVTYVSDPITNTTTSITRALCGEGTRTGARVLVTAGGVPLSEVKSIKLQRLGANRNQNRLDTVDQARNLPLQTVVPAPPCGAFQFHREYATVTNPIQLAPGSYQITVMAQVNGRNVKKSVGFDVGTCGFNPTIVVDF